MRQRREQKPKIQIIRASISSIEETLEQAKIDKEELEERIADLEKDLNRLQSMEKEEKEFLVKNNLSEEIAY